MVEVKVHLVGSNIAWHSPQSTPAGVFCSVGLSARSYGQRLAEYCGLFLLS
jgi:hypothetical protein